MRLIAHTEVTEGAHLQWSPLSFKSMKAIKAYSQIETYINKKDNDL